MVFDVNNRLSFKSMEYWMKEFQEKSSFINKEEIEKKPILILGNKSDIEKKFKQINLDELKKFGEKHNVFVEEVSAKKNSGSQIQNSINKLIDFLVASGNH